MRSVFLTGAAGFIGSNLADRLLEEGYRVVGFDNFSTGRSEFLSGALKQPAFSLVAGDLMDNEGVVHALRQADANFVFHLAANADVRQGTQHTRRDLEQNTIATFNLLDAMREVGVSRIAFASTGSIYGESKTVPTPEDAPFPVQTSLYGASKLACEGLIQAFAEGFDFTTYIFRFVSVLGERYTHGHVYDFCRRLLDNPDHLSVLGDGHQRKSYMYVQDCIDAMLLATAKVREPVNIFNLGVDDTIEVRDSVALITEQMNVRPEISFGGGKRGWIGDNPLIHLDCSRIRTLGWSPEVSIPEGIVRTLDWLIENPWVFES